MRADGGVALLLFHAHKMRSGFITCVDSLVRLEVRTFGVDLGATWEHKR